MKVSKKSILSIIGAGLFGGSVGWLNGWALRSDPKIKESLPLEPSLSGFIFIFISLSIIILVGYVSIRRASKSELGENKE